MSNILIVEDTLTQALLMEHMLKRNGFVCTIARSGAKALEILAVNQGFDAILSDVNMPDMDGMELCATVKSTDKCSAPFVLLLSLLDPSDVLKAAESGADNILLKEFDESYFVPQLKTIIELSRMRSADGNVQQTLLTNGNSGPLPQLPVYKWADMLVSVYGMAMHQKSAKRQEAHA